MIHVDAEVFDRENRCVFYGNREKVLWFLRAVKTPLNVYQIRLGSSGRMVSPEVYIEAVSIQESELLMEESDNTLNMAQFVSRFYEMQPATDQLLPNGRNLKEGMCVLIDDQNLRQTLNVLTHPNNSMFEEILYKARESNRWCIVTELEILRGLTPPKVAFTACYPDGLKRRRIVDLQLGWLVKSDTIPVEEEQDEKAALEQLRQKLAEGPTVIEGGGSRVVAFDGGSFWSNTTDQYTEAELREMDSDTFKQLRENDVANRRSGKVVSLMKTEESDGPLPPAKVIVTGEGYTETELEEILQFAEMMMAAKPLDENGKRVSKNVVNFNGEGTHVIAPNGKEFWLKTPETSGEYTVEDPDWEPREVGPITGVNTDGDGMPFTANNGRQMWLRQPET